MTDEESLKGMLEAIATEPNPAGFVFTDAPVTPLRQTAKGMAVAKSLLNMPAGKSASVPKSQLQLITAQAKKLGLKIRTARDPDIAGNYRFTKV